MRPSWDCQVLLVVAIMPLYLPGQGCAGSAHWPPHLWLHFDSGALYWLRSLPHRWRGWDTPLRGALPLGGQGVPEDFDALTVEGIEE